MKDLLLHALGYAHQREVKGPGSNVIILSMIRDIFPKWGDDSTLAWCSCFMNTCCVSMCYENTMHLKHPGLARGWLEVGTPVARKDLKIGDVVVFDRGKGMGHVGFFIADHGTHITVFGGNQADSVCLSDYKMPFLGGRRLRLLEDGEEQYA